MGDAGEGLVDAESRVQEKIAEREQEQRRREERASLPQVDPQKERASRSLQLARTELQRQAETTQNPRRKEQIRQALADLEKRLTDI
jgi:hypothetical protein